jgi:hypothetical protein
MLNIANIDAGGDDRTALLDGLLPGDVLHLDHVHDPDGWWVYTVTEAPTPGGATPPVAASHLLIDNYSGGFIRVRPAPDTPTTVDFAVATTPGPGGAVYPSAGDIPGAAAVWADFSGNLGHLRMADGTDVLGSTVKEWVRRGAVFNVHKDTTDPAHPNLIVGAEVPPPPPADITNVKVTSGGHGPTANPADGSDMVVSFLLMVGPTPPPDPDVWPPLDVRVLAGRLDTGTHVPDAALQGCLDTARAWVDPRTDPAKVTNPLARAAYLEGCYQLAVKVYDTGTRGMVTTDPAGGIDFTQVATAGMWRAVLGVLAPCLKFSGVVVG